MKFRILASDGGAHTPEKWALFTAEAIFNLDDMTNVGPWASRLMEARQVQLKIALALETHHATQQDGERAALTKTPDDCLASGHDTDTDFALAAVLNAIKGSSWEAHYAKPEVQAEVRFVLGCDFATVKHIERLYFADRNPAHAGAQAYAAQWRR